MIHTDTISAIALLVFPLSSLIVMGLSSFILSNAAGQSSCKRKAAVTGKSKRTEVKYWGSLCARH